MLKITLEKLSHKRRIAVVEEIYHSDIVKHIRGSIYVFETTGKNYFTKSMILDFVNQQLGWPCKNDLDAINEFNRILNTILRDYLPCPQVRGGYSFQLARADQSAMQVKVLKYSD